MGAYPPEEMPTEVGGAFSRMKQSFSETSLGGIASAAIGNLLDANSVAFHASTGEIAMRETTIDYGAHDRYDVTTPGVAESLEMGGARGTFLKKLPLPKLAAASAVKMTLSPGTPQKALETERELTLLDKIQQSRSMVLRL